MSCYLPGREPTCPVCGLNKIRDRASKKCGKCSRIPGWHLSAKPVSPDLIVPPVAEETLSALRKGPQSLDSLAGALKCSPGQALDAILALQAQGVNLHQLDGRWSVEKLPPEGGATVEPYRSRPDGSYRVGCVSDTHICSKHERLDVLNDLYDWFAAEGVDRVIHSGNYIDGEAPFNRYELLTVGMDPQLRYLAEHYPQRPGIVTYAVSGDCHEGWYCQRGGMDIGKHAAFIMREAGRTDWVDLGFLEAFISLVHAASGKAAMYHVMHPGGGTAYATSYTVQKIVESYEGGEKPAVLQVGHYHKMEFINLRNVWVLQAGCTQDQTIFARKKKIQFSIGGSILDLKQDPKTGAIFEAGCRMRHYFNRGFYGNNRWNYAGPVNPVPRVA